MFLMPVKHFWTSVQMRKQYITCVNILTGARSVIFSKLQSTYNSKLRIQCNRHAAYMTTWMHIDCLVLFLNTCLLLQRLPFTKSSWSKGDRMTNFMCIEFCLAALKIPCNINIHQSRPFSSGRDISRSSRPSFIYILKANITEIIIFYWYWKLIRLYDCRYW